MCHLNKITCQINTTHKHTQSSESREKINSNKAAYFDTTQSTCIRYVVCIIAIWRHRTLIKPLSPYRCLFTVPGFGIGFNACFCQSARKAITQVI